MTEQIDRLAGIVKAETIKGFVARAIKNNWWLSACQSDATAFLAKTEKSRRADVNAYCEEQYRVADLDSRGRKV